MGNGQRVSQIPRLRLKKLVGNKTWKKRAKIRIGNWNVGSLTGKGRELVEVMQRRNIDILCISETWLDSCTQDSFIYLSNFNVYRCDHNTGGGVCVYCMCEVI